MTFRGSSCALVGLAVLSACVERAVGPESAAPVQAESFEIPFELSEVNLSSVARLRLRRLHELVQQGLHEEAKTELALLSGEPEAADLLETLERWDRYLDGCIAHRSLHGSAGAAGESRFTAGSSIEILLELLTSGTTPIEIPAHGVDDGAYQGEDEASFFKLRITEVLFDGLGARSSSVRWETVPLEEDLSCEGATPAIAGFAMPQAAEAPWAMKLVRVDATLYPCAARIGGRYVPMRPVPFQPATVTIYPRGWESLIADPLLALRGACSSEESIYDRHALIAASLLERGGEAERTAFAFLQIQSTQGAPRMRAKARAALDWLRLDQDALWAEATRLAPARTKERTRARNESLQLPGR